MLNICVRASVLVGCYALFIYGGVSRFFYLCNIFYVHAQFNIQYLLSTSAQNKNAYSKFDLLVATPMRLVGLLRAKALDLSRVRLVVLDGEEGEHLLALPLAVCCLSFFF